MDLSWLRLDVLAETVYTDVFEAEEALRQMILNSETGDKSCEKLQEDLGVLKNTEISSSTQANKFDTLAQQPGAIKFNQTDIRGASQVKSGKWLTNTEFEAMSGTPTTEPLFVTMGGSQWLVDLQYRKVSAPYVRKYHLSASAPNYRYYKLGDKGSGSSGSISYIAQAELKYNANITTHTAMIGTEGDQNYAFRFHSGGDVDNVTPTETYHSKGKTTSNKEGAKEANGNGGVSPGYTFKNGEYIRKNFTAVEAFYDTKDMIADVNAVVSAGQYTNTSTVQMQPSVAQAIIFKQQVRNAILQLQDMWEKQDDNYRADQGIWDEHKWDYPKADHLSFMYTYGGMVRHGNNKDNTYGAGDGANSENTYQKYGGKNAGETFWNPYITSYLFDWDNYTDVGNVDSKYGSHVARFFKAGYFRSAKDIKQDLLCAGAIPETECNTYLNGYIDVATTSALDTVYGADTKHFSTLRAEGNYINILKDANFLDADLDVYRKMVEYSGEDALVALTNPEDMYAFSAPLNGASMNIKGEENNEPIHINRHQTINQKSETNYNMKAGGVVELGYLYYRALYSLFLNYSGLFYYDEVDELFSGLPGFNPGNKGNEEKYNKAVNKNLAALFGRGDAPTYKVSTYIPFAIFPNGGYLDSNTMSHGRGSLNLTTDAMHAVDLITTAVTEGNFVYGVTVNISTTADKGSYSSEVLPEYQKKIHNYETNVPHHCSPGEVCCWGSKTECPKSGHDTCGYTHLTSPKDPSHISCSTCGGDGKVTSTCTNCSNGYTKQPVACDSGCVGTHKYPCAYDPGVTCSTCGGTCQVENGTCQTCQGTGSVVCPSTGKLCTNHTWQVGAEGDTNTATNAYRQNHKKRSYKNKYETSAEWSIEKSTHDWVESPKSMSYNDVFGQKFTNVEWLDLMAYKLWVLDKGNIKNLTDLLMYGVTTSDITNSSSVNDSKIVTEAVKKLGYNVYNLDDGDEDIVWNPNNITRNLQIKGRVANSWNKNSIGNNKGEDYLIANSTIMWNEYGQSNGKKMLDLVCYKRSDTPYLGNVGNATFTNFVNNDFAAFQLKDGDGITDDVYLEYKPLQQGGREDCSFYGFVNQALGYTFMYAISDANKTYHKRTVEGLRSYCNSLLVQGDHITLNRYDAHELALMGMYYDTWTEDADHLNRSNKFALLNTKALEALNPYYSTCKWVPGKLSYLCARAGHDQIYGYGNAVVSEDNNWIIHTYCGGINGDNHVCWDSTATGVMTCWTGLSCYWGGNPQTNSLSAKGNTTDKGTVTAVTPNAVVHISRLSDSLVDGTTRGTIVKLKNTWTNLTNSPNVANDPNGIGANMPYIGYGTPKTTYNGTTEITIENGYLPGYVSNYNRDAAFINEGSTKNFTTFGVKSQGEEVEHSGIDGTSVTHPYADPGNITERYPWLTDLNVSRFLDNNIYKTGIAWNSYISPDTYTDVDASKSSKYDYSKITEPKVYAAYDTETKDGCPNEIVIYNPVATQSATVLPLSTYMPDASNQGDGVGYESRYLKSFATNELRDTRIAERIDLENLNTEQYLTGSGVQKQTEKVVKTTHYEMREISQIPTSYYTEDDYVKDSASATEVRKLTAQESDFVKIESNGRYTVGLGGFTGSNSAGFISVDLLAGDKIKFKDGDTQSVVLRPNYDYVLPFSNFVKAYNGYLIESGQEALVETTTTLPLKKDMVITIGSDNLTLRKGTIFNLKIPITAHAGITPTNPAIELTGVNGSVLNDQNDQYIMDTTGVIYDGELDRYYYTYRVEVGTDTALNTLQFQVLQDCEMPKFENAISFEEIPLLNFQTSQPNDWVGTGVIRYSGKSRKYSWWYNQYLVEKFNCTTEIDYSSWLEHTLVVMRAKGSFNVSLNSDSLNDPHKVPNTLWKYYVLGWETDDGQVITDIDSPLLNNPTTILRLPGGAVSEEYTTDLDKKYKGYLHKGTLPVEYLAKLVSEGKVYAYKSQSGSYGLTLECGAWTYIDAATKETYRRSILTGYITDRYASVQFAEDGLMSLSSTLSDNILVASATDATVYAKNQYECIFRVTETNGLAYSVAMSQNSFHKIRIHAQGFEQDWEQVPDIKVAFEGEAYKDVYGDFLSLDDEFVIYWDNYTDLMHPNEGTNSNIAEPMVTLGRGWDNNKHCYVNGNNEQSESAMSSTYWQKYSNSNNPDKDNYTETTKWLREKYVVFNVDMYGFTEGDKDIVANGEAGCFNPTTPAFDKNGKPNRIVYIPAGTKVHLGEYKLPQEFNNTESGIKLQESDDMGRFVDYGHTLSKSPCGRYTYHFWCPLSVGEMSQTAHVTFVAKGFNQERSHTTVDGDGTTMMENEVYKTYAIDRAPGQHDEWDNPILTATGLQALNNVDQIQNIAVDADQLILDVTWNNLMFARYHDSANSTKMSTVGRMGALTVVDSGDPRYQDTFKNANDSDVYAIAPIVKRILRYSNRWVRGTNGVILPEHGSQMRYLIDPVDVRGRTYISNVIQSDYKEASTGDTYGANYFKERELDTYEIKRTTGGSNPTQEVIGTGPLHQILPMTSDFNVHKELRDSMTLTKLGYELYCTLETIGSYFGSSGPRGTHNETNVNSNNDYGQTKVQVHPMYVGLNIKEGKVIPVDVYMRKNGNYRLVNAGSRFASEDEMIKYNENPDNAKIEDAGPYYLDDAFDATYTSSIVTNSESGNGNNCYPLSQDMLRRSVSSVENERTWRVLETDIDESDVVELERKTRVTATLLKPSTYNRDMYEEDYDYELGADILDYSYVYGNAQILFLREYNRTFVGGESSAIKQTLESAPEFAQKSVTESAVRYGQKWHFGIGLPASAVFVEHGVKISESNILTAEEGWYILCIIDAYAIGEKWVINYQSSLSTKPIVVGGKEFEADEWNQYKETFKHVIPVAIYMPGHTSASDKDTYGTH